MSIMQSVWEKCQRFGGFFCLFFSSPIFSPVSVRVNLLNIFFCCGSDTVSCCPMPLGTSRCGENFISALSTLIKESEPAVGGGRVTEHEKEKQINVFVLCPGYFDHAYLSITMFPKSVQRLQCIIK